MNDHELILDRLEAGLATIGSLRERVAEIEGIGKLISDVLIHGGTLYTCGNGGSAAQAAHLAEELIGRYRADRPAMRAVCLNADFTAVTCIANDYGYEQVFARQCEALLTEHDALLAISTSGMSANLVQALQMAKEKAVPTIGLLGGDGGACLSLCDRSVLVPASDSAHAQEAHQVVLHLLCEVVEQRVAEARAATP